MSKPTKMQHDYAVDLGEQAARAGRKESDCQYRVASTEPMRTLREAWIAGHQRATMAKRARRA